MSREPIVGGMRGPAGGAGAAGANGYCTLAAFTQPAALATVANVTYAGPDPGVGAYLDVVVSGAVAGRYLVTVQAGQRVTLQALSLGTVAEGASVGASVALHAGPAGSTGAAGATGARGAGLASHVQYGLNALSITYGSVGAWTVGYAITVLTGGCVATGFEVNWTYSGSGTDSVTFLIWDNAGTLLASATGSFTTTGYQVVSLASPLTMTAGTYTLGSSKATAGYCKGTVSPKFGRNFGGNWTITSGGDLLVNSLNTRPTSNAGAGGEVYAVFFGLVTS